MMKLHNVLLACALGVGTLLGAAAPASAAHLAVVTARPAVAGHVFAGHPYYGGYRTYGYRTWGYRPYGYPYHYGYGYPYGGVGFGVGVGLGYGYVGGGYGYVGGGYPPYPVYGGPAYWAYHPYWHPYRRVYWGPRYIR
jgi:hypothetical protein